MTLRPLLFPSQATRRLRPRVVDPEEATGLGVMGEQRLAETACSRLSRRKVSTLLGGQTTRTSRHQEITRTARCRVRHQRSADEQKLLDAIAASRSPALLPLFILAIDTGLRFRIEIAHPERSFDWRMEKGLAACVRGSWSPVPLARLSALLHFAPCRESSRQRGNHQVTSRPCQQADAGAVQSHQDPGQARCDRSPGRTKF